MQWATDGVAIPWYQAMRTSTLLEGSTRTKCASPSLLRKSLDQQGTNFTEFDVVPVYSQDPDMLIKVSNALNIQVKD